jgi:hypothetical protein
MATATETTRKIDPYWARLNRQHEAARRAEARRARKG